MHAAGHLLLEIQFTSSLLMWGLQPAGDCINCLSIYYHRQPLVLNKLFLQHSFIDCDGSNHILTMQLNISFVFYLMYHAVCQINLNMIFQLRCHQHLLTKKHDTNERC